MDAGALFAGEGDWRTIAGRTDAYVVPRSFGFSRLSKPRVGKPEMYQTGPMHLEGTYRGRPCHINGRARRGYCNGRHGACTDFLVVHYDDGAEPQSERVAEGKFRRGCKDLREACVNPR